MKKQISTALMASVALAAVLTGSQAFAGVKYGPTYVFVSDTGRYAGGNLSDARSSSDFSQSIGCQVQARAESSTVFCSATTADGTFRLCYSSAPALLAAAGNLQRGSYLGFSWDDSSVCTQIDVLNLSGYTP